MNEEQVVRDYTNNREFERKINFVISQPRCGSTLLMRLLNIITGTRVTGEHPIVFFESVVRIWNEGFEGAIYDSLPTLEKEDKFADCYRYHDEHAYRVSLSAKLQSLLWDYNCRFHKTTALGMAGLSIKQVTDTLREMFEENSACGKLQIIFLTRPHLEILESWKTSRYNAAPLTEAALVNQLSQMREAQELGDQWWTYEQLCADPQKHLLKMSPNIYPRQKHIDGIMRNRIR